MSVYVIKYNRWLYLILGLLSYIYIVRGLFYHFIVVTYVFELILL